MSGTRGTRPSAAALAVALASVGAAATIRTRGPDPEWARPILASRAQFLNALHSDEEGSVYITGYFAGTLELDDVRIEGAGGGDPFLVKLDPSGRAVWARQGTGPGWSGGRGIDTDTAGNVYWAGRFQGTIVFGDDTLANAGEDDIFVAKYGPGGELRWVRRVGGTGTDWGNGVSVDGLGNVFVGGMFEDTIRVGDEALASGGASDPLIVKLDAGGAFLWARSATGPGTNAGYEVAAGPDGESYLVGSFVDRARFGDRTLASAGGGDGYVARFDADGGLAWVRALAGAGDDVLEYSAVAADGDVFIAGSFREAASFAGRTLSSAGRADLFTARLGPDGTIRWTWTLGGPGDDGYSGFGQSVVILPDEDGGFRVATAFADSLRIGDEMFRSRGGSDVFVARFAGPGEPVWGAACGGPAFEGFVGVGRGPDGATYASTITNSPEVVCGSVRIDQPADRFGAVVARYPR